MIILFCINHIYYVKKGFSCILTIRLHKLYKVYLLYIIDINKGAIYRVWNLLNISLSMAICFQPGIFCSLNMIQLYQNMAELHL